MYGGEEIRAKGRWPLAGAMLLGIVLAGLTAGPVGAGETVYYHYDSLGRLVSACYANLGKRFRYAYDAGGNRTSWTVTTASCSPNTPPVAVDDTRMGTFQVGSPVPVDVLANDSDADGDDLTITAANCVSSGCSVMISPAPAGTTLGQTGTSPSLTVIATTNGTKIVTYTIADGHGGTATGTVTIDGFQGSGSCNPGGMICMPF